MQEVTGDLQDAARIIVEQNPNSLKWAQDRFWEFGERLAHGHGLVPDRSDNGFDWTGYYDEERDDMIFFDNQYGATQDPYADIPVSLRTSLQCWEGGANARTIFEARLTLGYYDEDGMVRCSGSISLTGQKGRQWRLRPQIHCHDRYFSRKIVRYFDPYIGFEYDRYRQEYNVTWNGDIHADEAREIFDKMARFYRFARR